MAREPSLHSSLAQAWDEVIFLLAVHPSHMHQNEEMNLWCESVQSVGNLGSFWVATKTRKWPRVTESVWGLVGECHGGCMDRCENPSVVARHGIMEPPGMCCGDRMRWPGWGGGVKAGTWLAGCVAPLLAQGYG